MATRLIRAIAVAALMVLAGPALAQSADAVDRLGVPGPIKFAGTVFSLAWSSQPSETYYKQEYVPTGQRVEAFKDMFLVEVAAGSMRPADAAAAQMRMLDQRKGSDPVVNYSILHNEKTDNVLLDFVLSDLEADPVVVEWNAYRYVPLKGGQGVALYGVSRRAYGEADAKAMLQGLAKVRDATLDQLASFDVPAVDIRN